MTKLSIVIPATGSQESVDSTLISVLENRPDDCEVVLAHGPDYHDPYDLGDEVCFVESTGETSLELLAAGIESAGGQLIHWLGCGVVATDGWTAPVVSLFDKQPQLGAASPTLVDPARTDRILANGIRYGASGGVSLVGCGKKLKSNVRPAKRIDGPLLQAGFVRAAVLDAVGPMTDRFGEQHIDSEFAARLRGFQVSCQHVPESQLVGLDLSNARGFRDGYCSEKLYWYHRHQFGMVSRTVAHAFQGAFDVTRQLPSPSAATALLGRACGMLSGLLGKTANYESLASETPTLLSMKAGLKSRDEASRNDQRSRRRWAKSA